LSWVLDASALVCLLRDEPGAERVAWALAEREPALIHAVNLLEVHYQLLRKGERILDLGRRRIEGLGLVVVRGIGEPLFALAVELKAHHAPIALGDVFAVALAMERHATLLTTDRAELQKIHDAGLCQVEFLR